jgi:GYF domain 2
MQANWYYIENDETVGPTTPEDLARRIGQSGESRLVWTQGMAEWTDAGAVPALSRLVQAAQQASAAAPGRPGMEAGAPPKAAALRQRLGHELFEYAMISTYLFICFGALLFYKAAILRSDGIEFAPFGIAAIKALVLGKFVLILHALKIGERKGSPAVLLLDIFKKSVVFLIFLSFLAVLEEIIAGFFHGREIRDVISEIGGGTLQQVLATGILLLLILIPYFTFRIVSVRLGDGVLLKLLTERSAATSS